MPVGNDLWDKERSIEEVLVEREDTCKKLSIKEEIKR